LVYVYRESLASTDIHGYIFYDTRIRPLTCEYRMLEISQICDMWGSMRYSHGQLFSYMLFICQSIL